MIRYKPVWAGGCYMVQVFNGVESGGYLTQTWHDLNDLRHDMERLDVEPAYPPDVDQAEQ